MGVTARNIGNLKAVSRRNGPVIKKFRDKGVVALDTIQFQLIYQRSDAIRPKERMSGKSQTPLAVNVSNNLGCRELFGYFPGNAVSENMAFAGGNFAGGDQKNRQRTPGDYFSSLAGAGEGIVIGKSKNTKIFFQAGIYNIRDGSD